MQYFLSETRAFRLVSQRICGWQLATTAAGEDQPMQGFLSDRRRAHLTASAMDDSPIPRSSSFLRTASARCTRTGVRTICAPNTSISRYSKGASESIKRLGRVTWFLDDSFTSMSMAFADKETKNIGEDRMGQDFRVPGLCRLGRRCEIKPGWLTPHFHQPKKIVLLCSKFRFAWPE